MGQYTREELQKFREDIAYYYERRKMFAGLGWASMGLGILFFVIAIVVAINGNAPVASALIYFGAFGVSGAIVLWILRSALYNQRIKNRRVILEQAKEEHEIDQMFDNK
ncbi:MAG: phage holin family protein [Bacilli bacterium]|nr:phage holin family protein [Bacilli bacterium]MBO4682792.1 phage holin family protein [Bacilli bacterium]